MTRRRLAVAAAALIVAFPAAAAPAYADTSPGPPVVGYDGNKIDCAPEQYPRGGTPRNASPVPYMVPFTATLGPDPTPSYAANGSYDGPPEGGYFEVQGASGPLSSLGLKVIVVLGASPTGGPTTGMESPGQLYSMGCGVVDIPSLQGGVGPASPAGYGQPGNVNPNFAFAPAAPVGVGVSPAGIVLPTGALVGSSTADGFLSSSISPNPAANGGLNITFSGSFRATTDFTGLLTTLQGLLIGSLAPAQIAQLPGALASALTTTISDTGNTCTIAIGNLATDGVPEEEIPDTGLTTAEASEPVNFTTQKSGAMQGSPVTGPVAPTATGLTQDQAALVSNDFPVGKIVPGTPDNSGDTDCSATGASTLNTLIGLPSPAGNNMFYAPSTFGVFTSS